MAVHLAEYSDCCARRADVMMRLIREQIRYSLR
jgi:hypothetical protein